jgi:hypothetical protein
VVRQRAGGLRAEEHLALLQQIGAVRRVLPIVLVPGPILGAAVPVGHAAGAQDDIGALGLQEGGERLMVGPAGFEPTDDLAAPRGPLGLLDPGPELGEAPGGVRDRERGHDHSGVGVAEVDHVLRLGDVEPDEEPRAVGPQRGLQLPEPLDTGGVVSHSLHGVLPPRYRVLGLAVSHPYR